MFHDTPSLLKSTTIWFPPFPGKFLDPYPMSFDFKFDTSVLTKPG